MKHVIRTAVFLASLVSFFGPARAEIEIDYGAFVDNDLRIAVDRVDEARFERNQTTIGINLKVGLVPDKLRFVGDLEFAWTGFTRDMPFEGLTTRAAVSPYFLESNAAYVEAIGLLPGLDLRVGRQIVQWGAADMFNPTNNLNSFDLEDPIKFGETVANEMIRLDYTPNDNFVITAVWVPLFQPALLPQSALVALSDTSAELPYASPRTRLQAEKLRDIWLSNPNAYVVENPVVTADLPDFTLANSQFGFKLQWTMGLFDSSISYYQGRDHLPVPVKSLSVLSGTAFEDGITKQVVSTDVKLVYPKKKVVGFDLTGQVPFLDNAGIWFEGALVFPDRVEMDFDIRKIVPGSNIIRGDVVSSTPFFKCITGMDYSINEYLFITGQFIHGFVDEFGENNIKNYWVGGVDMKFLREKILIRLFFLGEIPHEDDDITLDTEDPDGDGIAEGDGRVNAAPSARGATDDGTIASYVIYPQITFRPINSLELTLGGYFLLGHQESKFAMDAAGPSLVFFRARATY